MRQLPGPGELFLDHVGHFVPDLDAAAAVLEAAGFVLTPRTRQQNRTADGLVPSGTSNRCVMLREGYLEVLAATDDTPLARQLEDALARYTGIHLVALATDDVERATERLAAEGFAPRTPVDLRRPVETEWGEPEVARFTVLRVPPGTMPEGRVQILRHRTEALVWQRRWLAHANGVVSLLGALVCVDDPDEAAARFARFAGVRAARRDDGRRFVAFDRGALAFVAPEALAKGPFGSVGASLDRGPGARGGTPRAAPSAVPRIVATALGSDDPALTAERFAAAGIEPLERDGSGAAGRARDYAFPRSLGGFASVVPDGASPPWLV